LAIFETFWDFNFEKLVFGFLVTCIWDIDFEKMVFGKWDFLGIGFWENGLGILGSYRVEHLMLYSFQSCSNNTKIIIFLNFLQRTLSAYRKLK